ncbi:uncharacterized protein METZ01_LOCUS151881 [marine metagenome]|uniref:Radical SAM core domain-containing protein n=1 Tax=marine metagenome TaxID=408172 RepID=A0A382ADG1_9ZZZZ
METRPSISIPDTIELEIVKGLCSADCPMCSIGETRWDRDIMSQETFTQIIDSFGPSLEQIRRVVLVGIGEALLDKNRGSKIQYLKDRGIETVGIPTNASHLTTEVATTILESGLSEVIIGLDSMNKDVFEGIRKGLNFERILENTHKYIEIRDSGHYESAVMIRMITSDRNVTEWNDYVEYWSKYLDYSKGDMLLYFPEHNWSEHDYPNEVKINLPGTKAASPFVGEDVDLQSRRCAYVNDRYNIDVHGNLKLCCVDINASFFELGNVLDTDPVELDNSSVLAQIRELMSDGRIDEIAPCSKCDVPENRPLRGYFDGTVLSNKYANEYDYG